MTLRTGPNGGTLHGQSLEQRFWAKVDGRGPDECWLWTASTTVFGHGQIMVTSTPRRHARAHRVSYELNVGPIPDGHVICHRCDVPACVNPAHLFAAPQTENIADMHRKGRGSGGRVSRPGEANPVAKITEAQAREVLAADGSCREVGERFGISAAQVSRIRSGKAWAHLAKVQIPEGVARG